MQTQNPEATDSFKQFKAHHMSDRRFRQDRKERAKIAPKV